MRKLFLFIAALIVSMVTMAADFSAVCSSGQTLYYIITDETNKLCITAPGDDQSTYRNTLEGDVVIPATVVNPNNSETYTVEGIGGYSFYYCQKVTSITLPTASTFTKIGVGTAELSADRTFEETHFSELIIPDNVTYLGGDQMFRDAYLSNITFGAGVTSIPEEMFFGCDYLKRVVFPNNVTTFANGLFDDSSVKYVELGNNVTSLKANTFGSKQYSWTPSRIDTIVINTVTPPTVSAYYSITTFYGELASRCIVWVPSEAVAAYKAADCWKDFKHILANGEPLVLYDMRIENNSNYSLHKARITLDGVAYGIYDNNINFKRTEGEEFTVLVTIGNPYYGIKSATFGGVDVTAEFDGDNEATFTTANKKDTLKIYYEQKIHPYDFSEVIPSGQTLFFKIIDAVNHKVAICNQTGGRSTSGNVSLAYESNVTMPSGALVIPTSITHDEVVYTITEVDTLAFNSCSSLTSLTIPEGITAIRASAFLDTYLGTNTELVIPQSCKRIEYGAFRGCRYNALNPGGAEIIEEYAFLYCPLAEIKPSSSTREIYGGICKNNALTRVALGENLEYISPSAFSECSNLKSVTVLATTPPAVLWNGPSGTSASSWSDFDPSTATLYVPWSADHSVLAAYQAASCWTLFGTILEIPVDPVENLEINFMTNPYTVVVPDGALPDGVVVDGIFHDNQHGYSSPIISIPVAAGNYKITIGNCQHSNNNGISVKNADESATLGLIDANGQDITSFLANTNCYHSNPAENITSAWLVINAEQTIKIFGAQYTPYLKFEKVESVPAKTIVHNVTFAVADGVDGVVPAAEVVVDGESLTIPANTTLYKEGYTLTGWNDGVKTWVAGEILTPAGDVNLSAVFEANEVNLLTATTDVVVKWFLGNNNGAPSLNIQNGTGILVAQATIGTATIDVKMDIDATASGAKCSNFGRSDEWAQVNNGTILSFPSKEGATVELRASSEPSNTTVDGKAYSWASNVATFATEPSDGKSALTCGANNTYMSYLQVNLPASSASALEDLNLNEHSSDRKLLLDGQLLIIRGGKVFNANGAQLR